MNFRRCPGPKIGTRGNLRWGRRGLRRIGYLERLELLLMKAATRSWSCLRLSSLT